MIWDVVDYNHCFEGWLPQAVPWYFQLIPAMQNTRHCFGSWHSFIPIQLEQPSIPGWFQVPFLPLEGLCMPQLICKLLLLHIHGSRDKFPGSTSAPFVHLWHFIPTLCFNLWASRMGFHFRKLPGHLPPTCRSVTGQLLVQITATSSLPSFLNPGTWVWSPFMGFNSRLHRSVCGCHRCVCSLQTGAKPTIPFTPFPFVSLIPLPFTFPAMKAIFSTHFILYGFCQASFRRWVFSVELLYFWILKFRLFAWAHSVFSHLLLCSLIDSLGSFTLGHFSNSAGVFLSAFLRFLTSKPRTRFSF